MGFNLALRKLTAKKFVQLEDIYGEDTDPYPAIAITRDRLAVDRSQ